MTVLVTGGAGFIGSVTVDALLEQGDDVVVLDDMSAGDPGNVHEGASLVIGDIADQETVRDLVRTHEVDACVHFAGKIAVGESVDHPDAYFDVNVVRTLAMFDVLVDEGVERLVFSSSAAVYGEPDVTPIPEAHRLRPTSPYGQSKAMIEGVLSAYDTAFSLRSVSLRYFNAAGATSTRRERHDPETHLIPLVLDVAAGRRPHITVFGDDYATTDGTAVRDYVHVSDLADAHVAALDHLRHGGGSDVLNLGTGTGASVLEVIRTAREITGRPIDTSMSDRRSGDPAVLVADPSKARKVIAWASSPRSDLDEIIESAWTGRR